MKLLRGALSRFHERIFAASREVTTNAGGELIENSRDWQTTLSELPGNFSANHSHTSTVAAGNSEASSYFSFEVLHESTRSSARVGRIHTPHGAIDTPAFVAVGTNAALKGITAQQAEDAGLDLLFCNSYHLLLQPGSEAVQAAGGIHAFMGRRKPIITDSGGFQIFSLAYGTVHDEMHLKRRTQRRGNEAPQNGWVEKVSEEGVVFRSYRDGSRMLLTPETCVAAQKALGADIILPLDELPPYHVDADRLRQSVELSHRWMERSLAAHLKDPRQQAMYGIIHGGSNHNLRRMSSEFVTSLPFDGYAMGGTLGKDREEMIGLMKPVLPNLPPEKPRHVLDGEKCSHCAPLNIGIADDHFESLVAVGADTFDSCYPTRVGRHGTALTSQGRLRVLAASNRRAFDRPMDATCTCPACKEHSVGYLNHLIRSKEPLAGMLIALHNVHFMCKALQRAREAVMANAL